MKKIFRSSQNKVLGGICGGIGEAYGVDPKLMRLAFIFVWLVTGIFPLLITYIVAWIVLPVEEKS